MPLRRSIAAIVILFATAAHAAQTRIVFEPHRAVEAGEVVTIGWEGLPANVDELEFLLVTGDGEPVRLTPQLMPSNGSFGWTVPNLPSRAAVLELRAGIEGEEIVLALSEPFVIRGAPRAAHIEFRDGEWWGNRARSTFRRSSGDPFRETRGSLADVRAPAPVAAAGEHRPRR